MNVGKVENTNYYNSYMQVQTGSAFKEFSPVDTPMPKTQQNDTFTLNKVNSTYGHTFTGSKQEIEAKVSDTIDKGCELYNIPEELKPNFVVEDMLQYESPEEISARLHLENTDIFKNSDKDPQNMTPKEFSKYLSEHTDLSKKEIENITKAGNGKDKGCYVSANHTITYYTQGYRNGTETIEETIYHELYHAKEAIARSSLSQESRDEIVKNELLSRLQWGETRTVFRQFPKDNDISSAMMEVPVFDSQTKQSFTQLAQEDLFTDDWSMYEKMQRYTALLEQEHPDEEELLKARNELGDFADKIDEIAKNGKISDSSSLWLSNKDKTLLLMNYAMSVEFRYQYFREQEIKNVKIDDSDENKKIAQQSVRNHIDSTQANYALTIARQQKNKRTGDEIYWQYFTSREEVNARLASEKNEIEMLKEQRKLALEHHDMATSRNISKQLRDKETKYKEDKTYIDFYEAEDNLKSDSSNLKYLFKYVHAKNNVEYMRVHHNHNINLIAGLYFVGGVGYSIAKIPQVRDVIRRFLH